METLWEVEDAECNIDEEKAKNVFNTEIRYSRQQRNGINTLFLQAINLNK